MDDRRSQCARAAPNERRILAQHPGLEFLQTWARIDAQLVHQSSADTAVGAERFGLATQPGIGTHQQFMEWFSQRVPRSELFEFWQPFEHAAGSELEPQTVLGCAETEFLPTSYRASGEGRVAQSAERRPMPSAERLREEVGSLPRVGGRDTPRSRDECLDGQRIDAGRIDVEHISRPGRTHGVTAEYLSKLGDPHLQRIERVRWHRRTPHVVDELIDGDNAARIECHAGEDCSGTHPWDVDRVSAEPDFEGPQQVNLERLRFGRHPSDPSQETVSAERHDVCMSDQPMLVSAAIARLVGEDPLASVILAGAVADNPESFDATTALALVTEQFDDLLAAARALAAGRRQRQHVSIIECWLRREVDRAHLLSREHLADFPDDVIVSWLAAKC